MSEYVNKDNTPIHEYITSPSLDPSEVVQADEHGVYPINPLGFPDTSFCADAHPVDAEGETVCIGKANAAYPQANQFSVESSWTGGILPARADMVEIGANVVSLEGQTITFPVVELNASTPGVANSYIVKVNGDISSAVKLSGLVSVSLTNAGFETYASTGLLGTATISGDSLFDGTNTLVYLSYTGCTVTGHIGAGRLNINISIIDPVKRYVLLTAQDNPAENGLYQIVDDGPWVRMSSVSRAIGTHGVSDSNPYENPASLDNSTLCGHVRHGYSDREVAERVERQAGVVIQNARHPIAEPGNLGGAGNLTRWFVECGPVVLGSSHGSGASVVVDGFGLGGYHSGVCTYGEACSHVNSGKVASDDSPVTTFSIGTSPTAGQSSLPRDWPFTTASDYAGTDKENNITLVKDYVTLSGSSTRVGGISKRVHICVNSNFSPSGDGTTRFKKTYVHLPAPIDTKDGEEFEVTVSLPTVNVNNAYHETVTVQDISAYYEYISQPRVVVMGGYWKFSNTEVEWDESRLHSARPDVTGQIDINGAGPFVDSNGNAVAAGTRIRFTLDGINNCPRFTDITGTLSTNVSGHIVISALDNYPYGARMRGLHMKICGIAYLDTANAEQNNFTDTPMGLHGRNSVTMGADTGNGEIGDLSQYNKFVTPLNANIEGKKSVNGIVNTDQVGDPRQILASVYPTVTNTFQWSLVGRHKMRKLDDLMTDEWDIGDDSVSAMIWDSNKKVIDFTDTVEFFGYGDEEYGFTADTMPTRYCKKNFGAGKSVIGSQLRIFVPDNGFTDATANPVRQACKAARMFADDFRKLRMYHGSTLPSVSDSSKIRTDDSDITSSLESYFSNSWSGTAPSDDVQNNSLAAAAWITKVRHLPEYIVTSGQVVTEDGNSIIGANPFVDSDTKGRYSGSFISEKYGNTEYGSSTATETVPCDVKLPGRNDAFAYRSVISAMVASDDEAVKSELYMDANRVAELQMVSIDHWKNGLSYNYMHPYGYLLDSSGYKKWMDIYSATANVFSIDTIPVPSVSDMPSGLDDRQLPMISSDPLSTYRKESNTNVDFAAANLPFYDESSPRSIALTNLLRNMVPAYGSRMPVRFWDGTRVAIASNGGGYNEVLRLTRLVWPETECVMPASVRCDKVDDEFISRSSGASALDVNLHYMEMDSVLHLNCSEPPVKVSRQWYNKLPFTGAGEFEGPSGYVRIFMKFKFSANAGRWYTVDYMQEPMSYLSPLYGANALESTVDGVRIWGETPCAPEMTWKDALMKPYYKYEPMDINTEAIPKLVGNIPPKGYDREQENNVDIDSGYMDMSRFEQPYMSVETGGLGLSAASNANGDPLSGSALENSIHANFWSVRKHLRPAVSVLDGTDIPGFNSVGNVHSRAGGTMGDSVLWGQFDFPKKGQVSYVVPVATEGT